MKFFSLLIDNNKYENIIFVFVFIISVAFVKANLDTIKLNGINSINNKNRVKNEYTNEQVVNNGRAFSEKYTNQDKSNRKDRVSSNEKIFRIIKEVDNDNSNINDDKDDLKDLSNEHKSSSSIPNRKENSKIEPSLLKKLTALNKQKFRLNNSDNRLNHSNKHKFTLANIPDYENDKSYSYPNNDSNESKHSNTDSDVNYENSVNETNNSIYSFNRTNVNENRHAHIHHIHHIHNTDDERKNDNSNYPEIKDYSFFDIDQEKLEQITNDIKSMKANENEYIDVQFIMPENKFDQLKPIYVKKPLQPIYDDDDDNDHDNLSVNVDSNSRNFTNNGRIFRKRINEDENKDTMSKKEKRREIIKNNTLRRMKRKRALDIDKNERKANSMFITSDFLTFDYFCNYDISEQLCNHVAETLKKCSQYIQKMVTIKRVLHITVDYYEFCLDDDCSKRSSAVASSSPSSLYILSDANGVEWSFPKALYKQIHTDAAPQGEDEDIYVQINSNYEFYFGESDKFSSNYRDLLYILLHEITHGLGFLSFLDTSFLKDYPEIFKEASKTSGNYLTPQSYYSHGLDDEVQFVGWVPLCIFDRYLMYHEEYVPIYNLYLNIMNSSNNILRKHGGIISLKQFIEEYENEDDLGFNASRFLFDISTGKGGSISFGIPSDEYIQNGFNTEFKYITITGYVPLQSFCNFWSSSSSISHIDYSFIDSSDFLMVYMAKKGRSLSLLINNGIDSDGWDVKDPDDGIYPIWGPDTQKIMKTIGWETVMEDRQIFNRHIGHVDNQCELYLAKAGAISNYSFSLSFKILITLYTIFGIIYYIF